MTTSPAMRGLLGFVAAAISVLTFHQGMWALLHVLDVPGLGMPPPYPTDGVPPLAIPRILDLCFWGGLYGVAFGLLAPRFTWPLWLCGLITGIIAALVGMFIVPAIKGLPVGAGWVLVNWLRSFLINGCWGLGLGLIFPLLAPTAGRRRDATAAP
jgi:hypothetical protein